MVNKDAQTHFIFVIERGLFGCTDKRCHVGLLVNDVDKVKICVFELHMKYCNINKLNVMHVCQS